MKKSMQVLSWSLLSAMVLGSGSVACSHGDNKEDRETAIPVNDRTADVNSKKSAGSEAHSIVDSAPDRPKAKARKTAKRTQEAAERTAAAVSSGATGSSDDEYLADVDAAMGEPIVGSGEKEEPMNAATSTAINSEAHENTDADNSQVKHLNSGEKGVTVLQQGDSKADIEITRKIRRSITSNKSLSSSGHNVKIITRDGRVLLRGPVPSENERKIIEKSAVTVAGAANVTSGIEVKSK